MNPPLWILGAGGLLGSTVLAQAHDGHRVFEHERIDWTASDAPERLQSLAAAFCASAVGDEPWSVVWCAGAGVIGTSQEALSRETATLEGLLRGLDATTRGTMFLASSAGGVFGGTPDRPITERSEPAPLSPYGRNKLVQEHLVATWVAETSSTAVIGRISNLYGPGQSLAKPQGLISQICAATLRRRPITLYVPTDTIRDYLFADDCAGLILRCLERSQAEPYGACTSKILASGQTATIGTILSEAQRVMHKRPSVVSVPSHLSNQQGSVLSFRSEVWPELDRAPGTTLASGIAATVLGLERLLGAGALS